MYNREQMMMWSHCKHAARSYIYTEIHRFIKNIKKMFRAPAATEDKECTAERIIQSESSTLCCRAENEICPSSCLVFLFRFKFPLSSIWWPSGGTAASSSSSSSSSVVFQLRPPLAVGGTAAPS